MKIIHKILRTFALRYLVNYSISKSNYESDIVGYLYDRVSWEILTDGNYEGELQLTAVKYLMDHNIMLDSFVDCGANIGTTSIQLSKYFKEIFSIESYQRTYVLLELNTQNYTNIKPIHASLSDKIGVGELSYGVGFLCGASLKSQASSTKTIKVKTTTLDNIFQNVSFKNLCIKLDIEGLEYQALLGATNIINNFRPILFIEINNKQIRNDTSDAFSLLSDLNYCFYNVQKRYLGKNIILRNLKMNNLYHVVRTKTLIKRHTFYKFMICIPKEKMNWMEN